MNERKGVSGDSAPFGPNARRFAKRPFPHERRITNRSFVLIAFSMGFLLFFPFVIAYMTPVPVIPDATVPTVPNVPVVRTSGSVVMDITGNVRHYLRDTAHASEVACTYNKVATTGQGSAPVNQISLLAPQDACWYADSTTGQTIPAGDWESLLDMATTSGNVDVYLHPSGGGTYANGWDSQNAGCTITTHWACVEELWPPDDATSYVIAATTTGDKESNAIADFSVPFGFTDIDITIEYRCAAASGAAGGDSFMLLVVGAEEYTGAL